MSNEITDPKIQEKLNELGRRLSLNLVRSDFYLKSEPKVQMMMRHRPPFMLYRLKDNEQIVYITQYHTKLNEPDMPVVMSVQADPKFNDGLLAIHEYFGVVAEALDGIMLRAVAEMEGFTQKIQSHNMKMINLANRQQAVNKARRVESERRLEKKIWENQPRIHKLRPDSPSGDK